MTPLDLWGWACAAMGSLLAVPQFVKLARDRDTAGLSLVLWQLNVAIAVGWTVHGWTGGWWNMVVPNAISGVLALLVLRMVRRARGLRLLATYGPGVAVGLLCVGVDRLAGPAAFGIAILVPLLIGQLDQLRAILFDADISGVSFGFLAITLALQGMWGTWALWAGDTSVLITASSLTPGALLSVAWFLLRRYRKVGPLRPPVAAWARPGEDRQRVG